MNIINYNKASQAYNEALSKEGVILRKTTLELSTYTGAVDACTAGQSFSYDVTITYTDKKTGAEYTYTGGGVKLDGTCANSICSILY